MMKKERLDADLKIIISACQNLVHNIDAIILYGGYGREEGAWIQDESGNPRAYNDYDILIISNDKVSKEHLDELRIKLAKMIGISWVDISIKPKRALRKLKATIFNFDLKNGSRVIYGDFNILNEIPNIRASDIGYRDVRILFYTRIITLIGCCKVNDFKVGLIDPEKAMFFRSQISKAVFSVIDLILITEPSVNYESSYKKRVEVVKSMSKYEGYFYLFDWALDNKLKPSCSKISKDELNSIYNEAILLFMNNFTIYFAKVNRLKSITYSSLIKCYKNEFQIWLRRLYYFLKRSDFMEKSLYCDKIQLAYLLANPQYKNCSEARDFLIEEFSLTKHYDVNDQEYVRLKVSKMRLGD
ncbi:nucleotidyltransferase domain-containing protein [Vibrio harveyi]|nr:nucleotidyltransferase domain-containing protein [Vibrio harveyi]